MQRMGVHQAPIVCMFTTIQNLNHYIRTIYGDSSLSFSGKLWTVPIQGVGQGNGAGPQIWAVVSTPVLNMLRAEGYGAFFKSSISGQELSFVGYAFVDDADLVTTAKDNDENYQVVVEKAQGSLTAWDGGICATGGAIEPTKSHWYLITFKWQNGDWKYASIEETPADISVKDCNGEISNLERLEVWEAQRTLGVRIAPDGNNIEEAKFLQMKTEEWADKLRTGHIPRRLAWMSMLTTIIKSIQYCLPATTLTEKQCAKIMSPMLLTGLSCSGVVRTLPRVLVYSPKQYQGLGLPCLYTTQHVDHIERIMKFCFSKTNITGQLIRQSIEATKLEIGCSGPLLARSFADFGCLATKTWITATWEFLSENNLRMEDDCDDLRGCRENDVLLMEAFFEAGYRTQKLRRLNLCRLFMNIVSLGEIATGCGWFIQQTAWEGSKDATRKSPYNWPNQGNPSSSDWAEWRMALQDTFCGRNKKLNKGLGKWLTRAEGIWFFDPMTERLYKQTPNNVLCYPKATGLPSRAAKSRFSAPFPADKIPSTAKKATVAIQASRVILTGFQCTVDKLQEEQSMPHSFREFVEASAHPNTTWAFQALEVVDGQAVAAAIQNGTCTGVSDGSFKNSFGTASWTIQGEDTERRIRGSCITPGNPEVQSAYRSELAGLYGIVSMIELICMYFMIEKGTVEVGCDGLQALKQATFNSDITNPKYPQFDLISAIRQAMRRCPINWKTRHIKGHQDDDLNAELDSWAKLNVEMDKKAKEYWNATVNETREIQQRVFGEQWSLWSLRGKICVDIGASVIEVRHGKNGRDYWDKAGRFKIGTSEMVD